MTGVQTCALPISFGSPSLLGQDSRFKVPWVWGGSTDRVLVMEHLDGISVGEADVSSLSQPDRDDVRGRRLMFSRLPAKYSSNLLDCCTHPGVMSEGTFRVQGYADRPELD